MSQLLETQEPTDSTTVTIGGLHWALGLQWSSYGRAKYSAELTVEAKRRKATHIAHVAKRPIDERTDIYDYGFARGVSMGKKTYAAAAALAATRLRTNSHAWSAVYELPNQKYYWLGVLDGGSPAPQGEWVGDWQTVLAFSSAFDCEFNTQCERFTFEQLQESLSASRVNQRFMLKPVKPRALTARTKALALGLALGVGYAAYLLYPLLKRQSSSTAAVVVDPGTERRVSPRSAYVKARALLLSCKRECERLPLVSIGGWQLHQIECSAEGLRVRWSDGASFITRPQGLLSADGKNIDWHKALDQDEPKSDLIATDPSDVKAHIQDQVIAMGAQVQFTAVGSATQFEISTDLPPWILSFDYDGVVIHRLVYADDAWRITGEIRAL